MSVVFTDARNVPVLLEVGFTTTEIQFTVIVSRVDLVNFVIKEYFLKFCVYILNKKKLHTLLLKF